MRIKAAGSLLALFACSAFGQTDRVLRFWHTETKQNISQIATLIHVVGGLEASGDPSGTLKLRGTAERVELAEWIFHELDKPQISAHSDRETGTHEFRLQGGGENTVRLFYIRNTAELKDFHNIATAVSTVADLTRVGTYGGPSVIAVRGTPDQVALAGFLVSQLDRSAGQPSTSAEYRLPAGADRFDETLVRIFYIERAETVQNFQEMATVVRTMANIRRVYAYNPSKAMIVRSTTGAVAFADWLIQQLDKPTATQPGGATTNSPSMYEYDASNDRENIVRVFYLPQTSSVQEFQQVATHVRTTAGLRRVLTYNAVRAMAVRGTATQIATADQLMKELEAAR